MHLNTKQELIVIFLEVLHPFFCFIYWQKKGCKSKPASRQQWWQCYVTFTFWAWLDNCPRCCSEVRHQEFSNSPPQKGNFAQNTWEQGYTWGIMEVIQKSKSNVALPPLLPQCRLALAALLLPVYRTKRVCKTSRKAIFSSCSILKCIYVLNLPFKNTTHYFIS